MEQLQSARVTKFVTLLIRHPLFIIDFDISFNNIFILQDIIMVPDANKFYMFTGYFAKSLT
jgi:hypothetical protein